MRQLFSSIPGQVLDFNMDFESLAWANMIGWIVMLLFEVPLLVKSIRGGECG